MIGGSGEKVTLRLVAQHADIWNGMDEPAELGRLNGVLDEWCAKTGRDPKEIERSALIGARHVSNADEYVANGITYLIVGSSGPGAGLDALRALVEWRDGHNQ